MVALLMPLLSACATSGRRSTAGQEPARRLVLALDGIDYRDIVDARARGLFAQFRAPSRLISTFPSISDIAWHDILAVQPPRGYQRIYYSNAYNEMIGGALDAIRPIEFEDRMDMAFGAKFHHLGAYLISNTVAKREVDVTVRDFFDYTGQRTVYVYNVGPDALQHTRGDLPRYLEHLDRRLNDLQVRYQRETGRALEIVVLSDHGHNRGVGASFLPVTNHLAAHGFTARSSIRASSDVAFSVDGVTTGFGIFASETMLDSLTHALLSLEGVDVVTQRENDSVFLVRRGQETARIEQKHGATDDQYRYLPLTGDPLDVAAVYARMRQEGATDDGGYATSDAWVRYTATSHYPAAVVRIARGHTTVTLNPAPILVSVKHGFRVGLGMVSVANRMRPLGGTHGALDSANALGVLMTTYVDTQDDLTSTVRRQLDEFEDLRPVHARNATVQLTSGALIRRDRRNPFHLHVPDSSRPSHLLLEIQLTSAQRAVMVDRAALFVEMRESRAGSRRDSVIGTSYWVPPRPDGPLANGDPVYVTVAGSPPATVIRVGDWRMTADHQSFLLDLSALVTGPLRPSTAYTLRVLLDRLGAQGNGRPESPRTIATLVVRTNHQGELWPY